MIRLRALLLPLCILVAWSAAATAPEVSPLPSPRPEARAPDALALVAEAGLSGTVAFIVVDLETGAPLEGGEADLPLPLASVAKAPTAVYALDALGPDHRFETRLVASGTLEGGSLSGDLVLQGGGDPETDSEALDLLAFRAKEAGLDFVSGRFLVDAGLLPTVERIDPTQPDTAAYNPSVGGLNLNYNRVFVEWRRRGGAPSLSVEARAETLSPVTAAVRVEAHDVVSAPGAFAYLGGAPETWHVAATALARDGGRWLPVRRPADYAGEVFVRQADEAGLRLPPPEPGAAPAVADVIARVESRPLADILTDMMRYSTNLTAEAVGLAATRAVGGSAETLEASAGAMNAWAAQFTGFPPGDPGFRLTNHSGLSAESRASVRRLAEFLVAAERRGFPALGGGRAATLRGLTPDRPILDEGAATPAVAASVRAKTGTMNFVSALAGYIEPEAGRRLAFAIIAADLPQRAAFAMDEVETPPGARAWAARARALQRALIRSWIARYAAPRLAAASE
ncbi:MAG: D-alanyl-D-alanine carboxypeptidase/D-alanyl-D-alanine-endopeptidase [Pikeienuella sp.]|uniref:D-alanyl-D-alanine carboxypeptidase/D-alanyl-D-alanine endopeptidase n=1 Tax=Pikeienuella sp. TaxID=2831957 RepID=UPI00391DFED2